MMSPLPSPPGFRGAWWTGAEAIRRSGRISGPFSASPRAYAAPAGPEDLSRLIRFAAAEGIPLVPRGGGTGMPGGNLGPGIVVSLREGFSEIDPPESSESGGAITAGAGVVAAEIAQAAAAEGWVLPALPSSAPWCTIGGMVANQAAGARSFGHGAIGSFVEELRGIDARGEPFQLSVERRSGPLAGVFDHDLAQEARALPPRPVLRKNASGYGLDRFVATGDPAQLLVGSEGTLGVITSLRLRLRPAPRHRGLLLLPVSDPEEASALAVHATTTGAVACEFLGERFLRMAGLDSDERIGSLAAGAYALFLLEFEGSADEVRSGLRTFVPPREAGAAAAGGRTVSSTVPDEMHRLWALRHRASPLIAREAARGRISTQFIEDSVVPPAELGAYLVGLEGILQRSRFDAVVFGHAGDGNVHVNPLVDVGAPDWKARVGRALEETVDLVTTLGGTLTGEHGDGRLRAPFLERVWGAEWFEAFRALKERCDPQGILNPGVILPLAGQDPLEGLTPRPRAWPG